MDTKAKISTLQKLLIEEGLDAWFLPTTDPHMSEYVAERWREIAWLTGFTGSRALVIVTRTETFVWVDSRYYVQADRELEGTGITVFKAGMPGVPSTFKWIPEHFPQGSKLGIPGDLIPISQYNAMVKKFEGIEIVTCDDLIDPIWSDRPAVPDKPVIEHELRFAGESRKDKIDRIKAEMKEKKVDCHIVSALDDIAWTFNIRGADIAYNPVVYSFAAFTQDKTILFIDQKKLDDDLRGKLESDGVLIQDYDAIVRFIDGLDVRWTVLVDQDRINRLLQVQIEKRCKTEFDNNIPMMLKLEKNEVETENIRKTHVLDGAALVKWQYWIEQNIGKVEMTEYSLHEKLEDFRGPMENYRGPSFYAIVGYNANAALPHYSPKPQGSQKVEPRGILLCDSGGQYDTGTTDITRTILLGDVDDEVKTSFTAVLRGMINLSRAVFRKGVKGIHLDALAHEPIWSIHQEYGHGTGHGVGMFLCVHEPPIGISLGSDKVAFAPGMLVSNEPGIYVEGHYGIRIENLIMCRKASEDGEYLAFETMAVCPIDHRLIDVSQMRSDEIAWLNDYHKSVREKLTPYLTDAEADWLKSMTEPIG